MILNIKEKIKKIKSPENDVFVVLIILAVGLISFGLGRLSALAERKTPIVMSEVGPRSLDEGSPTSFIGSTTEKLFVASKGGTKYHYPWCSGALRIKEENKIWFNTKEEAEAVGYTPASNCKGL
ncbi:hypothetical protein KKB69_02945 [Patescibacteria group bacterium]|nr:hypothetical protein [Patescibacteria group bacterium]